MEQAALRRIEHYSTDNHFIVRVIPPFAVDDKSYNGLNLVALNVRNFDDGSQIFSYDHAEFGNGKRQQEKALIAFTHEVTKDIGGVLLDATVRPIPKRAG